MTGTANVIIENGTATDYVITSTSKSGNVFTYTKAGRGSDPYLHPGQHRRLRQR